MNVRLKGAFQNLVIQRPSLQKIWTYYSYRSVINHLRNLTFMVLVMTHHL